MVILFLLSVFLLSSQSAETLVWSRSIPRGSLSKSSPICTSMQEFRQSLVGFKTAVLAISAGSTTVTCSNATIAKQITDSFASISSGTFACEGKNWYTGLCGDGAEISVSVDDSGICACNKDDVVIRPCINNANWGGSGTVCDSVTTTLRMTVEAPPTLSPTATPTETPTIKPTFSRQPTFSPTAMPTKVPTLSPSATPTSSQTFKPTVDVDLISDFDAIDKNGDGSLNYDEIAFAIADTNKDNKLSLEEYESARANRVFVDTAYTITTSITIQSSDDVYLRTDFDVIDKNGDGFLNFSEIAFAIADFKKDSKLSLEEYEAARADRIFPDTSYTLK